MFGNFSLPPVDRFQVGADAAFLNRIGVGGNRYLPTDTIYTTFGVKKKKTQKEKDDAAIKRNLKFDLTPNQGSGNLNPFMLADDLQSRPNDQAEIEALTGTTFKFANNQVSWRDNVTGRNSTNMTLLRRGTKGTPLYYSPIWGLLANYNKYSRASKIANNGMLKGITNEMRYSNALGSSVKRQLRQSYKAATKPNYFLKRQEKLRARYENLYDRQRKDFQSLEDLAIGSYGQGAFSGLINGRVTNEASRDVYLRKLRQAQDAAAQNAALNAAADQAMGGF